MCTCIYIYIYIRVIFIYVVRIPVSVDRGRGESGNKTLISGGEEGGETGREGAAKNPQTALGKQGDEERNANRLIGGSTPQLLPHPGATIGDEGGLPHTTCGAGGRENTGAGARADTLVGVWAGEPTRRPGTNVPIGTCCVKIYVCVSVKKINIYYCLLCVVHVIEKKRLVDESSK